ncbi:hypothetical protein SADUNF_Sadunf19G0058500 [Salix dunnii]|uniref:Uncharacterized protein n=1 Tax=Salix dunnii TaxID=1413687 RepID=A0A835J201_9ROSI|nr:hypothetical protein SADUNF_Sadunf19G0058500 [Salix dunnii]
MEGGAEKKRKRGKKKDFECDGKEEGCHGRSVEVSASVMGLFSELPFNGSGSSSGGTGHAPSIWPSIKKFEKKEEAQKKRKFEETDYLGVNLYQVYCVPNTALLLPTVCGILSPGPCLVLVSHSALMYLRSMNDQNHIQLAAAIYAVMLGLLCLCSMFYSQLLIEFLCVLTAHRLIVILLDVSWYQSTQQAEGFINWLDEVELIFNYKEGPEQLKVKLVAIKLKEMEEQLMARYVGGLPQPLQDVLYILYGPYQRHTSAHLPWKSSRIDALIHAVLALPGPSKNPTAVGVGCNASTANGTVPTGVIKAQQPEEEVCSNEDKDEDLDYLSMDLSSSQDELVHGFKFFKSPTPGSSSLATSDRAAARPMNFPINSARFPTPMATSAGVATPPIQTRSGDAILEPPFTLVLTPSNAKVGAAVRLSLLDLQRVSLL